MGGQNGKAIFTQNTEHLNTRKDQETQSTTKSDSKNTLHIFDEQKVASTEVHFGERREWYQTSEFFGFCKLISTFLSVY